MGISSKKTKTSATTSQTTSGTQTPTNPEWVKTGLQGMGETLTGLRAADPRSFVAGADGLQTQAAGDAAKLTSSPDFGMASSLYGDVGAGTIKSESLLDNLAAYMSPYTKDVVDTTLAGFDQNANMTRQQQTLDLNNDATFGGSGGSILRAMTEGQLGMGRAQTEAQLRDSAFTTGASLSSQDADRRQGAAQATAAQRLAAAGGLAATGAASGADERANLSTKMDMGSILQAIAQNQAAAPLATAGALSDMWARLPAGLLHGQEITGKMDGTSTGVTKQSGASFGDWLGFFASNASRAAGGG